MPLFTDDDRGKPVENAAGETVGTIESVEGDVAHVRPDPDAIDSVKSSIGWDSRADEPFPLDGDAVSDVTDEAVRLEGKLEDVETGAGTGTGTGTTDTESTGDGESSPSRTEPAGGMSGTDETDLSEEMADDDADVGEVDSGTEADATELTDDASGFEVHPDDLDDRERTDAAVEPTDDHERSDATVEPDDDLERTDTEAEPTDGDRDSDGQ